MPADTWVFLIHMLWDIPKSLQTNQKKKLRGGMCGCGCVCVRSNMGISISTCEQFGKHISTGEQFVYFISQSTENETKPKKHLLLFTR